MSEAPMGPVTARTSGSDLALYRLPMPLRTTEMTSARTGLTVRTEAIPRPLTAEKDVAKKGPAPLFVLPSGCRALLQANFDMTALDRFLRLLESLDRRNASHLRTRTE